MALENDLVEERVRSRFGAAVLEATEFRGDLAIRIRPEALPDVALYLHTDPDLEYALLSSVTGGDYLGREPRFEVVYHFSSLAHGHRVALKVAADEEDPRVPSIARLFPTATFQERE